MISHMVKTMAEVGKAKMEASIVLSYDEVSVSFVQLT